MLKDDIKQYVAQKRAIGFKYRSQNLLLQNFAKFAEQKGEQFVRTQTVLEWAKQAPSRAQSRNRLLTIRRFAIVMQTEDERYQIPPVGAFGHETFKRCIPHIYTLEELNRLIMAAKCLTPKMSLRPITFSTLFALLAATGLRISEALALSFNDITNDGLIIRATKFRKDRLVPLHKSAKQGLEHFLAIRSGHWSVEQAIFISLSGTRLSYSTVNHVFLELIRSIGLREGPGSIGPRIHDLRHTFAVRSLEQCSGNSVAIARHITALSTYLGHVHVSDTYWYLHATPKIMMQIATAGEMLHRGEQ